MIVKPMIDYRAK